MIRSHYSLGRALVLFIFCAVLVVLLVLAMEDAPTYYPEPTFVPQTVAPAEIAEVES